MENHQKRRKMKKKHEVANEKKMKIWTQSCRFSLRTRKSSKTRGNFHFFNFFFIFLSFFFIFLARGTWNPGKPWKTMENHQKQRKMKNKWSCKWKKMKIWTQSCRFSLRTRKSSKLEEIFVFFIFSSFFYHFFSFSLPVAPEIQESHEKQWKTMENHQKRRKMKKKNEVANEKNMKIWTQSCRFSLRTRKSSKTRGNFLFFFSFFYHFPCPWHLKSRKAMKNNGKPSKTKENEKQMKLQMKKNENLDSKLQILTPNQEIFKNSRKISFFFIFSSFFYHFFSFSLPVAPEIQESHEKQWKTMENHQKQRKMKKKWSCKWKKKENLDSKLQILTPNQEIFKNSRKFSFFFHFPCPWHLKSRKTMKNNEKQWKTIKNKGKWKTNEVANEKKMKIWTQSCRFSLRTRKSSKTRGNFHFFFIFLARGTWNPGKPWKTMKNNGKPSKTKENEKKMKLQLKKNWKKWKFGLKVADSHSEPGNLQKLEEIFFSFFSFIYIYIFFFYFPCPWHLKSRKAMKNNEKQWKPTKKKENEKTWSCKWKKMKLQMKKMKFDGKRWWAKMKKWR